MLVADKNLRAFGRARRDIVAIYLFGSQVTGKAGPLSDLDVAVLLDLSSEKAVHKLDFRLNLIADIAHACRRSDVDVIVLNETPPSLAYDVIYSGRVVYERDHDARVGFEARTLQRYLDIVPFLAVSGTYLKQQLLDGTYGG